MTIQEQVSSDLTSAIKERNEGKKAILRVLIGEFNREGKVLPDEKATAIIKKMVANAEDMKNTTEAEILSEYLPKQLTNDQINMLVSQIIEDESITSMREMGKIMGIFKAEYAGKYDGSVVSKVIKERLS